METSDPEDEKAREVNRRKIQIIQQEEDYREEWSSPPVLRPPDQSPKQTRKPVNLRIDTEAANQSIVRTSGATFLVDIASLMIFLDVCHRDQDEAQACRHLTASVIYGPFHAHSSASIMAAVDTEPTKRHGNLCLQS